MRARKESYYRTRPCEVKRNSAEDPPVAFRGKGGVGGKKRSSLG